MVEKKLQVALGLSGGVDSAVSAALLLEQGYEVSGVFMECWQGPGCRTDADRKDALDVALQLGIPFEVLDFKQAYAEKVVAYFKAEYAAGRTPNPDVVCNREIKFGLFYDWAIGATSDERRAARFDFIATGHYTRIGTIREISNVKIQSPNKFQISNIKDQEIDSSHLALRTSHQVLLRGIDSKKDQSYFLHQLRGEQLEHILFPIGHLTKQQVRVEAKKRGLKVAAKPDSQGICFIGEVSIPAFLMSLGLKEAYGDVVMLSGKGQEVRSMKHESSDREELVIGRHKGAWCYTVGQKLGVANLESRSKNHEASKVLRNWIENLRLLGFDPSNLPPLYVVAKDVERNVVVVGTREQAMRDAFEIVEVHWINKYHEARIMKQAKTDFVVRIRHQGELIRATCIIHDSRFIIQLEKPTFGVAPGQACVFYQDEVCLGGGVIG